MGAPTDIGFFDGITRTLSSGTGQFRFLLQPLVAIFIGSRLGIADARTGRSPFLSLLFHARKERGSLFKSSLSDVVVAMCFGVIIDCIIQYKTLGVVRLLPALLVAFLLVWLPYSVSRALVNRVERRRLADRRADV